MMFLALTKADQASQTVWARATAEEVDKTNEILDYATAKPQFEIWSKRFSDATLGKSLGNVRAMHSPQHLAGKIQEIIYRDDEKAIDVLVKVLDPIDWVKVESGGYTGLSIGGGYERKWPCPLHKGVTRYTPRIAEISLVDNPCLKTALLKLELQKRDGSVEEVLLKGVPRSFNAMRPPATFDVLHKTLFSATADAVGRLTGHPAVNAARGAVKLGNTVKDMAHLGALGAGAVAGGTGLFAVHHTQHKKDKLAKPAYMQKSLASGLGELGARAGKFATAYGKTARSVIGGTRVGQAAGKVAAHPRVAAAAREIGHTGWKGAISPLHTLARAGAAAAGGGAKAVGIAGGVGLAADYAPVAYTAAKLTGVLPDKKPPALGKADIEPARTQIATTMHRWKAGKLRSFRGVGVNGRPRLGPKVTDQKQAIAIALSQARRMEMPRHMSKSAVPALIEGRILESGKAKPVGEMILPSYMRKSDAELFLDDLAKTSSHSKTTLRNLSDEHNTEGRIDTTGSLAHAVNQRVGALSDKEHAQRIAAAKARWMHEGHHDLDVHFDERAKQAGKAYLGRANKVAAVEAQRHNTWSGVADAQAGYDKVRAHLHEHQNLMMEVPHAGGLLYNPEGVGHKHFDHQGRPHHDLYMLHPAEADDWISKHGKHSDVGKSAPLGLLANINELGTIVGHADRQFVRLEAETEAA